MKLFFQEYGQGEPLVILHGLLGAGGNWHSLSRKVFAERFQVYTLDLRNHGRSPHSDVFDFESMVGDVVEFMDTQRLEKAHVLGHSMGGKVAMWLALEHATRVASMVSVDIAPRPYPPHHMHILNALKDLNLAALSSRHAIDEALAAQIKDVGVRQFLLKNLASNGNGVYQWKMNLPVIYHNYPRINEGIDTDKFFDGPALFVKGGASSYISQYDIPRIAALFRAYRLVELPGVGHWVHAEAPQQFSRLVLEFLAPLR